MDLEKASEIFERSPGKFFTRFKRNSSTVDWLLFNKRKNLIILQFSHDFIKCNQIFMKIISLGFVWPLGWWKFILPHKKALFTKSTHRRSSLLTQNYQYWSFFVDLRRILFNCLINQRRPDSSIGNTNKNTPRPFETRFSVHVIK